MKNKIKSFATWIIAPTALVFGLCDTMSAGDWYTFLFFIIASIAWGGLQWDLEGAITRHLSASEK